MSRSKPKLLDAYSPDERVEIMRQLAKLWETPALADEFPSAPLDDDPSAAKPQ